MNYDFDDSGSLGYCSDVPQFSPDSNNISWLPSDYHSEAWIDFTEQPADYRYRYLKEKYHGHIVGVNSPATKKKDLCKFPKLKLKNFNGSAVVRVWLISTELDKPRAHFHKLARKPPKGVLKLEPHDFKACEQNNYEVTLDYLHIIHAVSNDENDINVYRQKKAHIESDMFDPPNLITTSSKEEKDEIKQIDKNQSVFYIQVFDEKTRTKICQSIVSRKIKNLHNAETGALKIVNCSRTFGTCKGNDEVFIFVEKISKDVEVRFFKLGNNNERTWQAPAIYGPQHVHHQLGIVFRTPKFEQNVDKDTQVFFELHRKNDNAVSEPIPFTYKPHQDYKSNDIVRKRAHSPEIMAFKDDYLPVAVTTYNSKRIKDESMSPDSTTHQVPVENIPLETLSTTNYLLQTVIDNGSDLSTMLLVDPNNITAMNQPSLTDEIESSTWMDLSEILSLDGLQYDSVSSTIEVDKGLAERSSLTLIDEEPINSDESSYDDHEKPSHPTKMTLLSAIDQKKPLKEFNRILENIDDVNDVDYEGNAALHYAARSSVDYLEPLLYRDDVDKKLRNLWGDDVLLAAARKGNINAVKLLLENNFKPNVQNSRTGETPLHLAVFDENHLMAELLLKYGADPLLGNHSDQSAYEYSLNCSVEFRRLMHILMQKSMFPKKVSSCPGGALCSSLDSDLVGRLKELTVSTS